LFGVALFGLVAWLVRPKTSAVITAAEEKYPRLQLGMSAEEVAAILGGPPEMDRQLYGEWVDARDGRKWYRLTDSPETRKPGPRERLYDWRAWTFRDGSNQRLHIQVYFDQGRLVASSYHEEYDNAVKKWLRDLPFRPSRALPVLDVVVDEGHQSIPPP
jgi:hypothetical protein